MAQDRLLDLLGRLIDRAKAAGAEAADALVVASTAMSVAWRLGALEHLQRSEGGDIGLRVLIGRRQAMVSSADRRPEALDALAEQAVAMARFVPEDPYCGLAEPEQLCRDFPDLDNFDPSEPGADDLKRAAAEAEDAARAVPGITNSEGAEAHWSQATFALAASNGFSHAFRSSSWSVSASVLAQGADGNMERDYDYAVSVFGAELGDPAAIGRSAGERAVRRLGARKIGTRQVPILFDQRVARSLLGHFSGAINGAAIARGTSFLKDRMGERVFAPGIRIVDDPLRRRGLRSRPCDAEGLPARTMALIEDGVLTTWLLDLGAARQLGLSPTGHASRGTGGPPGPSASNLYLEAGPKSPAELMRDIGTGFLVTELIGHGVNGVTGDYSRGASGFWIENGAPTYPVSEVTVAGNLKDMFARLTPASDLQFRYGTDAPSLLVEGMTVAGT